LANIAEVFRPPLASSVGRISWFVYPVRLAAEFSGKDRDWICESLTRKGIDAGRYFVPLHRQPVLQAHALAKNPKGWGTRQKERSAQADLKGWGGQVSASDTQFSSSLPQTEFVADRVMALPFFNELTKPEIQEVCGALAESIRELRRNT
jgi:dTDP-4-amino-4,6-dideoxygalactose transaminase